MKQALILYKNNIQQKMGKIQLKVQLALILYKNNIQLNKDEVEVVDYMR